MLTLEEKSDLVLVKYINYLYAFVICSSSNINFKNTVTANFVGSYMINSFSSFKNNLLNQRFSKCGTRTTSGT